jgi:glucose-1-phosphate cytidylyltransferase
VGDVDIQSLIKFHGTHGKLATLTSVRTPARFGRLGFESQTSDRISEFMEKPSAGEGWVNGGFYILNRRVIDYISGDDTVWERGPIERITQEGQLMAYRHDRFWSCMDTLREKNQLEELWQSGKAPWKIW